MGNEEVHFCMIMALAGLIGLGVYVYREVLKEGAFEKVEIRADINKDTFTDCKEWRKVYDLLGVHFDSSRYNPREDLSLNQLEKYLSVNKK